KLIICRPNASPLRLLTPDSYALTERLSQQPLSGTGILPVKQEFKILDLSEKDVGTIHELSLRMGFRLRLCNFRRCLMC
ncbi:MAG: hypothetical protein ACKPEO_07450, partial [Sphaerospermopsis kisseleviana]